MWEQIEYRDFWDVPRLFIVRHKDKVYLFDCRFDEEKDEYPDFYKAYLFNEHDVGAKHWEEISTNYAPSLGEVKVLAVKFDVTRRKEIDSEIFTGFESRA
jgi:cytochrome oxidase Cu insertion factor (SCO1/SenC/PrrC family)